MGIELGRELLEVYPQSLKVFKSDWRGVLGDVTLASVTRAMTQSHLDAWA